MLPVYLDYTRSVIYGLVYFFLEGDGKASLSTILSYVKPILALSNKLKFSRMRFVNLRGDLMPGD